MKKKKVLLVTYYWPPSGGSGVQRWLKMSKYLASEEIELFVYTPENPEAPSIDKGLLQDIHPDITIIKRKIFEPYAFVNFISGKNKNHSNYLSSKDNKSSYLTQFITWIRGNIFIPDPRVFWIKPSVKFLSQYIQDYSIDSIITTGPPFSMNLIGLGIKKKFPEIKWLADFRDPWTFIGYFNQLKINKKSRQKHLNLERKVCTEADHVITVSPSWAKKYAALYNRKVEVIYNGYDEADFGNFNTELNIDSYIIRHFGLMHADRNPEVLWQSIQQIKDTYSDIAKKLKIEIYGQVNEDIKQKIELYKIDDIVEFKGYISHSRVVELMKSADILLQILNNTPDTDGLILGKTYEYLIAQRPILSIGTPNGDSQKIIEETKAGKNFSFKSRKEEITDYILQTIGGKPFSNNQEKIQKYSRKNQAEAFKKLLLS